MSDDYPMTYQPDVKTLDFTLGELFPTDDTVGCFLIVMSMASNAIALNRRLMDEAFTDGSPSCVYHLQAQLAHLCEAGRYLASERSQHPDIQEFLDSLPDGATKLLNEIDGLFPAAKKGKDPYAMGQQRGFVFHWPRLDDGYVQAVLPKLAQREVALEFDANTQWLERVHFADAVAYSLLDLTGPKDAGLWVEKAKRVAPAFELFVEQALVEYIERRTPGLCPRGWRGGLWRLKRLLARTWKRLA